METLLETSHLQSFSTVAKLKSFSKAAVSLGVSQSAISQSVKQLEKKLGLALIFRKGKTLELTSEGEKLFESSLSILKQLKNVVSEIQGDTTKLAGDIRLGTLMGIGKTFLALDIIEFSKKFPEIRVDLELDCSEAIKNKFEKYHLDLAVLPEANLPSHCEKMLFGEERIILVFPKNGPFSLRNKKLPTEEELLKIPLVDFDGNCLLFRTWFERTYNKRPTKTVRARISLGSHGKILSAVAQNLGIAVVPYHIFAHSRYRELLADESEQFCVSNERFYIVYHEKLERIARYDTFMKYLLRSGGPRKDF